ncbi:hypothetical protein CYY_001377 [Polysphondylium violaceum]|uniref:Vps41 beta-propeller domain-containing protein n=1 Tax=Polysphondylium violaceum TaxID=133409 RepID=A0A8J4UW92_9MYCE|nr:hypothetical protein CYY_001377 [Polysphondylium violaceum]
MNLTLIDPFRSLDVPEAIEHTLVDPAGTKANCAQFNRRGTLLAVGCQAGQVHIWDFQTKSIARSLLQHKQTVNSIGWSRSGKKILSCSNDGSVILWDIPSTSIEKRIDFKNPVLNAQLHPRDVNFCLMCPVGSSPILCDFRDMSKKTILENENTSLGCTYTASFNRKGEKIFIGDNSGMLTIVDYKTMKVERTIKIASSNVTIKQIEFSKNCKQMLINSSDKIIRLYSLDTFQQIREYQDSVNRVQWKKCCFSTNNEYVVCGMQHKSIHSIFIWSTSGVLVKDLEGPKEGLLDVIWHPLSPTIVSISQYGVIHVWNAYYAENWSSFAPDFTELEENEEYIEKEDEFDFKDEDIVKKILPGEEEEMVDVVDNEKIPEFSSDEEEDPFCFSTIPIPEKK